MKLVRFVALPLAILSGSALAQASRNDTPVHRMMQAVEENNHTLFTQNVWAEAIVYTCYREDDLGCPFALTLAQVRGFAQGWRVRDIYDCAGVAVVTWKRGTRERYSRVFYENGVVIRMVGDTAPLVCTFQAAN